MSQRTTARDDKSLGVKLRIHVPVDPYERPEVCEAGKVYAARPDGSFQVRPLDKAHPLHGRNPD